MLDINFEIYNSCKNNKTQRGIVMNFVAIDFETADNNRYSACSIGYAIVKDSIIVKKGHIFINPPDECNFVFTNIHKITKQDVTNAPRWNDIVTFLYNEICEYLPPDIDFIAHNSSFDKGVWNALFDYYGIERKVENEFYDTLKLSRTLNKGFSNHKLHTVVKNLGLSRFTHHNAMDDAVASAEIAIYLSKLTHSNSVKELWDKRISVNGEFFNIIKHPRKKESPTKAKSLDSLDLSQYDPINHPLNNTNVAITGTLTYYTREEFKTVLAYLGATLNSSVIRKTELLILCDDAHESVKYKKALENKSKRLKIDIINEEELLELLNYSAIKESR